MSGIGTSPGKNRPGFNLVHTRSKRIASTYYHRTEQVSRGTKLPDGVALRPKVGENDVPGWQLTGISPTMKPDQAVG